MLGLTLILMIIGACAAFENDGPPPYIQSRSSYSTARMYLQLNIPHDKGNITNPLTRRHFGYGHIAAVALALVEAYKNNSRTYDPLAVLEKTVPKAWLQYNQLASGPVNSLLAEGQAGIQPISTLIDLLCGPDNSVDECNSIVDAKIQSGTPYLKKKAKLLLQLGIVSKVVLKNMDYIDFLTSKDRDIPFLINSVTKKEFTSFIIELSKAITLLSDPTIHGI